MGKSKQKINYKNNFSFIDSAILNDITFWDYYNRLRRIALSRFKWNLPNSMNEIYLEKCLYYYGMSTAFKDKRYGFVNTKCSSSGQLSIYEEPVSFHCYSTGGLINTNRKLYTGLKPQNEEEKELLEYGECILIRNDWDCTPTDFTLGLFAYRLYTAERTADVNVYAQRTPVILVADDKQRLAIENILSQYEGNKPALIFDKNQSLDECVKALKTDAPFVADKICDYKDRIWNEALTFLGINNIMIEKKERLVSDEVNSNNELINNNLQAYLEPRKIACKEFNEKFGLTGTQNEISVQLNSDLSNIIKREMSVVKDISPNNEGEQIKEGDK